MRRLLRMLRSGRASATAPRLPEFIIAGAQKGGTSSLYAMLSQHPQVAAPSEKEVHFFDGGLDPGVDTYARGPDWYTGQFPSRPGTRKSFDATPLYLFNPLAPARIASLIPQVKIIILLRNPVARAISHYHHEVRLGCETLPIEAAMKSENQRLSGARTMRDYKDPAFIHHSYQARGRYAEQLERYMSHFPPEQLLVLQSESLFASPRATLGRVFDFVELDPAVEIPDLRPRNVGTRPHDDDDIEAYLRIEFKPHNEALFDLLGTRFPW